jgi:hypothetical protein
MFDQEMEYAVGASAFALSNPSILLCSSLLGSLEVNEIKFMVLKTALYILFCLVYRFLIKSV